MCLCTAGYKQYMVMWRICCVLLSWWRRCMPALSQLHWTCAQCRCCHPGCHCLHRQFVVGAVSHQCGKQPSTQGVQLRIPAVQPRLQANTFRTHIMTVALSAIHKAMYLLKANGLDTSSFSSCFRHAAAAESKLTHTPPGNALLMLLLPCFPFCQLNVLHDSNISFTAASTTTDRPL